MRAKTITIGALLALTAGFASSFASQANAADFSLGPLRGTHYGAPMATTHVWDGAYLGGFAGYTDGRADLKGSLQQQIRHEQRRSAFDNNQRFAEWLNLSAKNDRARSFGFFAGFNYQYDEAVLGFEADFTRMSLSMTSSDSLRRVVDLNGLVDDNGNSLAGTMRAVTVSGTGTVALNNLATLRARAGYTMGSFLPFVTAGLALTDYTVTLRAERRFGEDSRPEPIADSRKKAIGLGLAFGLGADVAVGENAFLRGEWQYAHFPDLSGTKVNINTIRAAAGVKF